MKYFFLVTFLMYPVCANAQMDSVIRKDNLLKTYTRVIKNTVLAIPNDFVFMGKEVSNDWSKTGLYALGTAGLILTDKVTTRFLHQHIEPNVKYSLPNISLVKNVTPFEWFVGNDAYMTYPIVGLYLGSLIGNNEKGQYVAMNALKSLTHSLVVSQLALKTIFGRNRPVRPLNTKDPNVAPWTKDNLDFFNSRDKFLAADVKASSFPSTHATAYFAIAKVFQMEYDNYWIPYGFMSIIFLSDIKEHNHWVSDMVIGGVVGTIIGRSIVKNSWRTRYGTKESIKKVKNVSFTLLPQLSPQLNGAPVSLYLSINFNGK